MVLGRAHSLVVVQKQAAIFHFAFSCKAKFECCGSNLHALAAKSRLREASTLHLFRRWQRGHACAPVNA